MFVPTLCYELNFPRTEKIRIGFMFRRLAEFILLFQLLIFLIQQVIHNLICHRLIIIPNVVADTRNREFYETSEGEFIIKQVY